MTNVNIPNTSTPNQPLVSVGSGNQVKWGRFPVSGGASTPSGLPSGASTGQMVYWNGTAWVTTTTPATGDVFQWNGSTWINVNALTNSTAASGDLSGSYPGPRVTGLNGYGVSATPSTTGQLLTWNGSDWVAQTPAPITAINAATAQNTYSGGAIATNSGGSVTNWTFVNAQVGFASTYTTYLVTATVDLVNTTTTATFGYLGIGANGISAPSGYYQKVQSVANYGSNQSTVITLTQVMTVTPGTTAVFYVLAASGNTALHAYVNTITATGLN